MSTTQVSESIYQKEQTCSQKEKEYTCERCQKSGKLLEKYTTEGKIYAKIYSIQTVSLPAPKTLLCHECFDYLCHPERSREWKKEIVEYCEQKELKASMKIVRFLDCDMNLVKELSLKDRCELEFLRTYKEPFYDFDFWVVDDSNLLKFIASPQFAANKHLGNWEVLSTCGKHRFTFTV